MSDRRSPFEPLVRFVLEQKLVVFVGLGLVLFASAVVAPFPWNPPGLPRSPVHVDALPDLGENQQIVFTEWTGHSPRDVEDQITYPLTVALLGVPGVRTIRSTSMFGLATVHVVFEEKVEFYWSRSRILERLASLPLETLPAGVQPTLGPDATGLGQVFWYTLEGRDPEGRATGGWGPAELRSIQDWYVRYGLASADGISEVASVGGFVQEYQIDVDPDALKAHGVTLGDVFRAVRTSNRDVGARTIEINRVEYVLRGLGNLKGIEDIEDTVVRVVDNVPIFVRDVANVGLGPAQRRGVLDKAGAEAVGGVAVVRFGANPLTAIENLKERIEELTSGMPAKVLFDRRVASPAQIDAFAAAHGFRGLVDDEPDQEAWLDWMRTAPVAEHPPWATLSRVTIVPFYDRTRLIRETLGTLEDALRAEILLTVLVVILMIRHLPTSLLVGSVLPISVGATFCLMKVFGVDANVVALSGIAIAIGTMVDMGIIVTENVLRHAQQAPPGRSRLDVVREATTEVAGAVLTAVATTVVGFLPVFFLVGAEGKLFRPLALTKTFALVTALGTSLLLLPPACHLLLVGRERRGLMRAFAVGLLLLGALLAARVGAGFGLAVAALGLLQLARPHLSARALRVASLVVDGLFCLVALVLVRDEWMPLGLRASRSSNLLFTAACSLGLLGLFGLFLRGYPSVLAACMRHRVAFLSLPVLILVGGLSAWLGFGTLFSFVPRAVALVGGEADAVRGHPLWVRLEHALPGMEKEFMPALDEGSFLFMPSTMAHASIGEAREVIEIQDRAISNVPEVESVVGKIGRVDSALDPAPIGMVETVVNYFPEYAQDAQGRIRTFAFDEETGEVLRDERGEPVPDPDGKPLRLWRDEVRSPEDIWNDILRVASLPGTTSAPRLQPIETRLIMLQSGMRARLGVKVKGRDLEDIERAGLDIERVLRGVPGVAPATVVADRIVGKPYLEIDLNRRALARHGLSIEDVQEIIEVAIGGKRLTQTVEGRERYPVRVRYPRELRGGLEDLGRILVPTPDGHRVPLGELAELRFERGPQAIRSEDTFLLGYVTFDRLSDFTDLQVAEAARTALQEALATGALSLPPGTTWELAGSWENQVRAERTLSWILPLVLVLILLLLYLQFRSLGTSLLIWSGVLVAWSGGFLLLWAWGRPGFLDLDVGGTSLREVFQVGPTNLSVAVWVGFLALFGIATDDGVVMATYLRQSFARRRPRSREEVRAAVLEAGRRRVRPCLMTTATTLLALLPVLTSHGRGADVMIPMALPAVGGMSVALVTMLIVPVLYGWAKEKSLAVSETE